MSTDALRMQRAIQIVRAQGHHDLAGCLVQIAETLKADEGGVCARCGGIVFDPVIPQTKREWVDLSDELIDKTSWDFAEYEGFQQGARWAQTKLKEMNA